jgi:hypothetical protein
MLRKSKTVEGAYPNEHSATGDCPCSRCSPSLLARGKSGRTLTDELNEIALRCARRPVISDLSADEVLGYDDSGIPAR